MRVQSALDMPLLSMLVTVGLVALALAAYLLVVARRRSFRSRELQTAALGANWATLLAEVRSPSRWLELCAMVAPLAAAAATALAIQRARAWVLLARAARPENAHWVGRGLYAEPLAVLIGSVCTLLPALLASAVVGVAVSARLRTDNLLRSAALRAENEAASLTLAKHPGPPTAVSVFIALGLTCSGLAPIAWAGVAGALHKLSAIELATEREPGAQLTTLKAASDAASSALLTGFSLAVAGTVAVVLTAGAFCWVTSPAQRCPISRTDLGLGAAALVLAAAVFALSAPMKRENELPWPTGKLVGLGLSTMTPELEGPDPPTLGPVLEVGPHVLALERVPLAAAALGPRFDELHKQFALLHPHDEFTGRYMAACTPDTPSEHVFEVLAHAARAGYLEPTFVFETVHVVQRPMLGTVELRRASGARVTVLESAAPAQPGTVLVRAGDAATYDALARRIVSARRAGSPVALVVHGPAPR